MEGEEKAVSSDQLIRALPVRREKASIWERLGKKSQMALGQGIECRCTEPQELGERWMALKRIG